VTQPQDKARVVERIHARVRSGAYPQRLWGSAA
jgi:hypothetical protein